MLTLTPSAATTIQGVLERNTGASGLRIQVESGGCAGLKYRMGLEVEADPDDTVIVAGGARVYLDPSSLRHLDGATIDFVCDGAGSGFRFDNPNAMRGCASCGSASACGPATARH